MVENLLDLSRLNAGALPPGRRLARPARAGRGGRRRAVPRRAADTGPGRGRRRRAPRARRRPQLQRVVVNVVENALKFSPADRDVDVRVAPRGEAVEVAVSDHGPGVASEDAERIFEPFARGGRTRDVPGSGLGLAIARGLAGRQRRRRSGSAPHRTAAGATFVLELPAARASGAVSGEPLILVVDDERPIRRALEVTLTKAGYRVATAGAAAETLTAAALSPPDLVILDLMLPDGDGADVCAELRDWLTAPILLISAVQDEPDKIRALDAGADDYLTKPFGVGELLARVRALLRRSDGAAPGDRVIEVGRLSIDLPRRVVTVAGAEIHLTPTEFDLLKELAAGRRPAAHPPDAPAQGLGARLRPGDAAPAPADVHKVPGQIGCQGRALGYAHLI